MVSSLHHCSCCFYCLPDPPIGAATAEISPHGGVNIFISGIGIPFQQSSSGHNLPALAIAALRHLFFYPCFLNGMTIIARETLYGCNLLLDSCRHGYRTGTHRVAIKMNSTGTALRDSATKFGSGKPCKIADGPEQWHRRIRFYFIILT